MNTSTTDNETHIGTVTQAGSVGAGSVDAITGDAFLFTSACGSTIIEMNRLHRLNGGRGRRKNIHARKHKHKHKYRSRNRGGGRVAGQARGVSGKTKVPGPAHASSQNHSRAMGGGKNKENEVNGQENKRDMKDKNEAHCGVSVSAKHWSSTGEDDRVKKMPNAYPHATPYAPCETPSIKNSSRATSVFGNGKDSLACALRFAISKKKDRKRSQLRRKEQNERQRLAMMLNLRMKNKMKRKHLRDIEQPT